MWRIQWPATAPDSTQSVACQREGDTPGMSLAHRRCLAGGVWDSVDASECESAAVRAVRMKVRLIVHPNTYEIGRTTIVHRTLCLLFKRQMEYMVLSVD